MLPLSVAPAEKHPESGGGGGWINARKIVAIGNSILAK